MLTILQKYMLISVAGLKNRHIVFQSIQKKKGGGICLEKEFKN